MRFTPEELRKLALPALLAALLLAAGAGLIWGADAALDAAVRQAEIELEFVSGWEIG